MLFLFILEGGSTGQTTTGRIVTGQNYLGQKILTGQSGLAKIDSAKFDSTIVLTGQKRTIGFCQVKEYKSSQNCLWLNIPFFVTYENLIFPFLS